MYLFHNCRAFALVLISLTVVLTNPNNSEPTYNFHICEDPLDKATDANFQSELTSLLDSLYLKAALHSFYNDSISTRLHGLFLCRGDVSIDTCQNCTRTASQEIKTQCASKSGAIIWYDECMLRYSNKHFFGQAQNNPVAFMWNLNNRTSPTEADIDAQALMYQLIKQASNTDMLFKTGRSLGKDESKNRYGLVQCTRDISGSSCGSCLSQLMKKAEQCCQQNVGWRIMAPSCNIRYENYIFCQQTSEPLPHSEGKFTKDICNFFCKYK